MLNIRLVTGPMFSGKTTQLVLAYLSVPADTRPMVKVFKPRMDTRFAANFLRTHDEKSIPAQSVTHLGEITESIMADYKKVHSVLIDEIQFLGIDREMMHKFAEIVDNNNIPVVVCGLNSKHTGDPWRETSLWLAYTTVVTMLNAKCSVCGEPATHTHKVNGSPEIVVEIGGSDKYEARCYRHWARK
jgi:thymidine kinase